MPTMPASSSSGYSPPIDMTLEACGRRLAVAEVGPDYLVIETATLVSPAEGVLLISVDGESIARRVMLPDGITPGSERHRLVVIETAAPACSVGAG